MRSVFTRRLEGKKIFRQLVEFAEVARKDGILALENKLTPDADPFLAKGVRLVVDGTDAEHVEKMLKIAINSLVERHNQGKLALDAMGKYGPAYGMVATLIGLVLMLGNLDDPDAIGPGMAVALLGTMYGCIVSSCIFLPLADKLTFYTHEEVLSREMIMEGLLAIHNGDNPRLVAEKLNMFLSARDQES